MQTSVPVQSRLFQFIRLIAILAILVSPHHLYAEVIAFGDVDPNSDPDLPIFGGTASQEVIVGVTDIGRLVIDVPAFTAPLISPGAIIGQDPTAIGEVVITGLGSEWESQGTTIIGDQGLAFMSLIGGAQFNSTDEDDGSGPVLGTAQLIVGYLPGSTGIVTIDGFASRMQSTFLMVGREGDGSIDVTNRGSLITRGSAAIGLSDHPFAIDPPFASVLRPTGRVTLSGLGSRWTVLDNLVIGDEGSDPDEQGIGILQIRDQALVQVGNYDIFTPAFPDELIVNRNGRIELEGGTLRTLTGSSVTNVDPIQNFGVIKGDGFIDGMLTINPTGELRNAAGIANLRQTMLVSGAVENNGLIESIGGEMEFLSLVDNTTDGDIIARDAVMRFNGGLINDGEIALGGDTTVYGNVFSGDTFLILSDSSVVIRGDLNFSAPAVAAFTVGPSQSYLDVIGSVELGSSLLSLNYSSGVASQVGDSYDIITASDGVTGMFANTQAVADGRLWDILYGTNVVSLTATGILAAPMGADFNGDGIVDALDLAIWQANYGITGTPPDLIGLGDADNDGDVDGRDFLAIQRRFGMPPLVAALANVPEPSSLVLMLGAVLGLGFRRR